MRLATKATPILKFPFFCRGKHVYGFGSEKLLSLVIHSVQIVFLRLVGFEDIKALSFALSEKIRSEVDFQVVGTLAKC